MDEGKITSAKRDIALSLFLIAVAIFAIIRIDPKSAEATVATEIFTHATLPVIYSAFLMLLSAVVLISSILKLVIYHKARNATVTDEPITEKRHISKVLLVRFFGTVVMLMFYAVLLGKIPLWIETTVFLAIMFVLYGMRRPIKMALISLAGGAAFHLLFVTILRLPI